MISVSVGTYSYRPIDGFIVPRLNVLAPLSLLSFTFKLCANKYCLLLWNCFHGRPPSARQTCISINYLIWWFNCARASDEEEEDPSGSGSKICWPYSVRSLQVPFDIEVNGMVDRPQTVCRLNRQH
jgi:hypothetical protein